MSLTDTVASSPAPTPAPMPSPVSTKAAPPPAQAAATPTPARNGRTRVVVLGAGMAGLFAAQQLRRRKDCDVTLVAPRDYFIFLPRLTELASGSIPPQKALLPLRDIWPGTHLRERASIVNPDEKSVVLESGATLPYDILVIAVGSETNFFNTPGAPYAFPFYTKEDMERLLAHVDNMLSADESSGTHTFTVIGGGPTGVEVISVLADRVRAKRPNAKLYLLERVPKILTPAVPELSDDVRVILERKGVTILTGSSVTNISPLSIDVAREGQNKETIPCYTTIWAAGSKPVSLAVTGVSLTARGEIPATPTLQLDGHPEVFVLGDVAGAGVPKTAQSAVQEANTVVENIGKFLSGKPGTPFKYNPRGVIIALEGDTCGIFFGKKLHGFLARTMRDTYYTYNLSQYK